MKTASHTEQRSRIWLAGGLIAAAAVAAYSGSFSGPFVFDDLGLVPQNPTIRHLWPLWVPLSPPPSLTVTGRPLLNLSLAINYAISGPHPWSYHALNLLIHVLAGLTLFGIVRRTLDAVRHRHATGLALVIALLWTVHPLQTESVTYVIQRAESLMGLFYLLTLYCFIRYSGELWGSWAWLSVLCCLLGMATKEVMVSAPVIVFLYDRTFCAGSFREAWSTRCRYYLGLGSTWVLLAWLVISGGDRGGTLGFGVSVPWWMYAAAQFRAVAHYLWLCVWPHPLVLDYGRVFPRGPGDILPYVPIVALLVGGTVWALRRRPALGFLGCWFLAILAPTSSVIPGIRQTIAEHRMYLPLAAVVALGVLAGERILRGRPRAGLAVGVAAALACGALTAARNRDYRSRLALWSDTVAEWPGNEYAHYNLAEALVAAGRSGEAIAEYREAVRLRPDFAEMRQALAVALAGAGRLPEAIGEYRAALQLEPGRADLEFDLGNALAQIGQLPEAIGHLESAVRLRPDFPEAWLNLGNALLASGRPAEAVDCYREALRLRPGYADARNNLGVALRALGRDDEARAVPGTGR